MRTKKLTREEKEKLATLMILEALKKGKSFTRDDFRDHCHKYYSCSGLSNSNFDKLARKLGRPSRKSNAVKVAADAQLALELEAKKTETAQKLAALRKEHEDRIAQLDAMLQALTSI